MIGAVATWFATSKVGRLIAAAGALLLFLATFGLWNRRKGAQAERTRQTEADHAAVQRADRAAVEYRRNGDAADRLRDGTF